MSGSLQRHAEAAQESIRALDRASEASRVHWDDATRAAFDRGLGEPVLADGRQIVRELEALAVELAKALAAIRE